MCDGILLVDKPQGFTSQDLCTKIKGITGVSKVGHTGTLDPLATGLMVVLLGKATRLNQFVGGEKKTYVATAVFGEATDTFDLTGKVVSRSEPSFSNKELSAALLSFLGKSMQTPPPYSAKKVGGKKLYEYARKNQNLEVDPCPVEVFEARLIECNAPDSAVFSLCVSKGTYIRSICDELGKKLSTFGAMKALRRTYVEPFSLENAVTLEELPHVWEERLLPMEQAISSVKKVFVKENSERFVLGGNALLSHNLLPSSESFSKGDVCAIFVKEKFLAMGTVLSWDDEKLVKPNKIFV